MSAGHYTDWVRRLSEEAAAAPTAPDPAADPYDDLTYMAWVLLANVSEGDWTKQTAEWQQGVARWRDAFHGSLADTKGHQ